MGISPFQVEHAVFPADLAGEFNLLADQLVHGSDDFAVEDIFDDEDPSFRQRDS
ncbi:hypothetical protein [Kitasatospora sp. HPMI-4]|uniref:hypothetical protein n=1 Tax=Kitasatospora sp. HPMI-4 TaxID=3448443 RepID=UPI003F1BA1B9